MKLPRPRCAPSTHDLPFFFEPLHHELADTARRLAMTTIGPEEDLAATQAGRTGETAQSEADRCRALARTLADAGLLAPCVPPSAGGLPSSRSDALDVRALCLVREALAWASGLADTVFAMQGLGSYPVVHAGNEAQRREFLPPVLAGRALAAFAITEPEAGSDVAALTTRARRDGDGYVLDGVKTFISNAGLAGHYVVFANANPAAGRRGITAFLVRPEDRGFIFEAPLPLIADHPVGTIRFDGLRLPAARRLGAEGEGFRIAMATLDVFRPTVGAAALGMARRALDEALWRATTRRQFGEAIAEFQTTKFYLAEMATELDAARLLVYRAAHAKDRGVERVTLESSMAKMYATEAAQRVVDRAQQLHGGAGVVRGSAMERLYREVRALRIYEGTTEIQRLVIAGALIDGERARRAAEESHAERLEALAVSDDTDVNLPRVPRAPRPPPPPSEAPRARPSEAPEPPVPSADTTRKLRSGPPPRRND